MLLPNFLTLLTFTSPLVAAGSAPGSLRKRATTCTVTGGTSDDTSSIISAFTKCASGGTIVFSKDVTYNFADPSQILPKLSGATVEINGLIQFPKSTSYSDLDVYMTLQGSGVKVTGNGTIDGGGSAYWDASKLGGPKVLRLKLTGSSTVEDITIQNSPAQHVSITNADGLTITGVKIKVGNSSAKNTDGFDISSVSSLTLTDVSVQNNDDCIAVNGGSGVYDLIIDGMTCTGGHGISIGSLGKDDADDIVDGVTVKNCVFENVNRAARIKAFRVSESNTGYAKNIVYTGNTVKSTTKSAICVTQDYEDSSGGKSGVSDGVGFPVSATFEKFTFESSLSSYENPMVNLACVTSDTCGPFTFSSLDLPTGATVACDNEGTVSGVTCGTTDVVSCN